MSDQSGMQLRDMTTADIDAVLGIEQQVHSHPWTRGMFSDSLTNHYICKIYEADKDVVGYAVLMPALDEVHLLDVCIAGAFQRNGLGKKLLGEMLTLARVHQFGRMILEVRRSNFAAIALYRNAGFTEIGVRHGYYPAANEREDAIVMEYKIQ